ncbi:Dipeptidyl aminopeptidase/acylaminoacyl peptidase [Arachidicoccus rhizosphaerae]|uniref:Dipeptidyl aminopeptidase/acylaminoacyl peptidase n=1 Tax=Arachidicoccus rhizosphaerae TaxID=551991 RepID=A0A1H3ZU52_9BACT|nr:prolyl oligopeptidase family serine peptidase [Arachidicoccus rhizosphaerae]SEA27286.1 Dipeptidyl aminopeptidase/acylaminoacyl peptidase [Arachidicoccus rhizosphaerae]
MQQSPSEHVIMRETAVQHSISGRLKKIFVLTGFLGLFIFLKQEVHAQRSPNESYFPTAQQVADGYLKSQLMDSLTKNKIYNAAVNGHWIQNEKNSPGFWYIHQMAQGKMDYRLVEAETGRQRPAFNESRLAALLTDKTGKSFIADSLPLNGLQWHKTFEKGAGTLNNIWTFDVEGKKFGYNDAQGDLWTLQGGHEKKGSLPWWRQQGYDFVPRPSRYDSFQTDTISGDGRFAVAIQKGNVFVTDTRTGKVQELTTDGTDENPYGSIAWSEDNNYFVAYHIFPVIDSNVYYVLSSVPGTTRGQLKSHPYKQPGDPFTAYVMHVFNPLTGRDIKVHTDTIDYFPAPMIHWDSKDPSKFMYERMDRGNQRFRIIQVDALSGDTSEVYDERAKTFIYESRLMTYYLPESHEIIYSSEKDGWQHLFLLDTKNKRETKITRGDWIVREVDSVDTQKREIWFRASGMNPGEDPYYIHYYRIRFDGTHLIDLTPEAGNHTVRFSPDKRFMLDTYSEVNIAPVTKLKKVSDAREIAVIEKANIEDLLATGVHLPTSFVAKGRDGKTDIYGIYCVPSSYDPAKKYPVIENIYAGPQDAFVPKSFLGYSEMQSIAELGFIVVQIDGMGTANRSKAFHDVCWKNLQDAGLPDRIAWIKALAAKLPIVDDSRVGIYGTSAGGQDALDALLSHPEFYKAGVAACGCHDNRIDKQWWNEQWMGYPVDAEYAAASNVDNAYKLKGSLLLIVGEADTNVPPESTYRVADALIKAGKAFDFLPVPGSDHTDGGPYGRARKKDFFVRHLLNAVPPDHNGNEKFTLPKTGIR